MTARRITAVLLALAVCAAAGCAGGANARDTEAGAAAPTRSFTDSLGREVSLPADVDRIAVSGVSAQSFVYALAPEALVGVAAAWDAGARELLDEDALALPVLGQLYGGRGGLNPETLLAAAPDVVIDVGEPKAGAAEELDALQRQTGIPFVHITAGLGSYGAAYRQLGELLGREAEAEVLAVYCESLYARMSALAETVGGRKPTLLYLLGDDGLNVIARGSYHAELLDLLADNAAVLDSPAAGGTGSGTDPEQLLLWDPEVIIFAPGGICAEAADDPAWRQLRAIRTGRYCEVPTGPYNWFGFPPGVQRCLGMLWLAAQLYPDAIDYDLREAVGEYFALFYHCALTDAQYDRLMENSTLS